MIPREVQLRAVERLLRDNPVVALLGARQVGKTTLARLFAKRRRGPTHFFDLESTADVARLADPLLALSPLKGLVVLDEVQRRPSPARCAVIHAGEDSFPLARDIRAVAASRLLDDL